MGLIVAASLLEMSPLGLHRPLSRRFFSCPVEVEPRKPHLSPLESKGKGGRRRCSPSSRSTSILSSFTMPSQASMLVLIARAARSAAVATDRFARLAEQAAALSPEAVAAASHVPDRARGDDPLLHRSAAAAPPPAMGAPNPRTDGVIGPGFSSKDLCTNDRVEFVEKDLESNEALWALYVRWCKLLDQKRSHDEMVSRFSIFKKTVLLTHRRRISSKANLLYKLFLNKFADGKLQELRANFDGPSMLEKKFGSSVLWTPDTGFLREVHADFKVIDGKPFVFFPAGKTEGGEGGLKELSTRSFVVVGGRLFADLPEGHELVILNTEFLTRRGF